MSQIPFIDLKAQQALIRPQIINAISNVLDHGAYILGPEVKKFENDLSDFCGAKHVLGCANGTDALQLALMAEGIGHGDYVLVPSFTFVATAEVLPLIGAKAIFVDVDEDTYNISPEKLEMAITEAQDKNLSVKAVIAVDLFGRPADYDRISEIAKRHNLTFIADAAQSFGATFKGSKVGNLADYTTTSFFPAKPLGCYGDGGAIFTNDADKMAILRSLHNHGQGEDRYDNVRVGLNSRLDSIQAAILIEKLKIFPAELESRDRIALRYNQLLGGFCKVPSISNDHTSAWAQYTVRVSDRDVVVRKLQELGIPTPIYYPRPIHTQAPYRDFSISESGMDVTMKLADEVFSLPMHPYLDEETQDQIVSAVKQAVG